MGRHWATEIYRIRDWAAVGGGCAPIFATSDWREGDVRREFFFFSFHAQNAALGRGSGMQIEPRGGVRRVPGAYRGGPAGCSRGMAGSAGCVVGLTDDPSKFFGPCVADGPGGAIGCCAPATGFEHTPFLAAGLLTRDAAGGMRNRGGSADWAAQFDGTTSR